MKANEISSNVVSKYKGLLSGNGEASVDAITSDSREVRAGSAFVAVKGGVDGHAFIDKAIESGASLIVAQKGPIRDLDPKIAWLHVKNTSVALASLADKFYGSPSQEMRVVGVTGTNGKTTTTYLIHHIMKQVWTRAGLLGTIKFDDGIEEKEATHTTPGAVALHGLLAQMKNNDCRGVAMEVSSHGLEQKRVGSVNFDVGVFSNLSQDHLDYHGGMDAYYKAKLELFELMIADKATSENVRYKPIAVINFDDSYGQRMVKDIAGRMNVWTYGMGAHCDFKISGIRQTFKGTKFQLDVKGKSYLVQVPLIGKFNVYNVVSAITACSAAGMKIRDAVKALAEAPQVPGRMENVGNVNGMSVFVDYAHTPDALANAVSTLRELEPRNLFTVFGCGGDRDKTKRPMMGEAAAKYSDMCIVTSDNPRSEDPATIIKMIEAGMKGKKFHSVVDRAEAIEAAIQLARPGDLILIAGKGHETYQEFAHETIKFDDRAVARRLLREERVGDLKERMTKVKEQEDRQKKYEEHREREERTGVEGDRPPRRDGDSRPPRRDGDDRPPRRENDYRSPRPSGRDGESRPARPPREGGDNRPPRKDGDARVPGRVRDTRPGNRDSDSRGPRRDNDSRPPRRDNDSRPPRRDNESRPPRRDNDSRPPRRDNDSRPPRRDNESRPPRRDNDSRPPRKGGDFKPRPPRDGDKK